MPPDSLRNPAQHRVAGPYRVTFSPEVWKLIGLMPSEAFQRLQTMLNRLADFPGRPTDDQPHPLRTTMGGMTVAYEVDNETRTLTVLSIIQTEPHPTGERGAP